MNNSFSEFSEAIAIEANFLSFKEVLLTQYKAILSQHYKSTNENSKSEEVNRLLMKADETIQDNYLDYFEIVKSAWSSHVSHAQMEVLTKALQNDTIQSYFSISKKVEDTLKTSMQAYTQEIFQTILKQQ